MTRFSGRVTVAAFPDLSRRFLKNGQALHALTSKIEGEKPGP
jgi:hypothetical protein